jgi:hypothetical protein
MESSFDEVGDYEHCIIVQHLAYSQLQDGNLFDDIFDQCIFDAQTTEPLQEIVFYYADETELGLPPEDFLPLPAPPTPQILTKCTPDDYNLCAHMSGGEIPINNGILKDEPTIDTPNLLAHLILLALVTPSLELILNFHILQMVHSEISPQMGSTLVCSLKKQNHHVLLNHPNHF